MHLNYNNIIFNHKFLQVINKPSHIHTFQIQILNVTVKTNNIKEIQTLLSKQDNRDFNFLINYSQKIFKDARAIKK